MARPTGSPAATTTRLHSASPQDRPMLCQAQAAVYVSLGVRQSYTVPAHIHAHMETLQAPPAAPWALLLVLLSPPSPSLRIRHVLQYMWRQMLRAMLTQVVRWGEPSAACAAVSCLCCSHLLV